MSTNATLAYTVHHKGRKYTQGMTREQIGPVADEFGDHVWEGGGQAAADYDSGGRLGSPHIPSPSALPGAEGAPAAPDSGTTAPTEPTTGTADTSRRAGRRTGSGT